jgi:hypothetical protein
LPYRRQPIDEVCNACHETAVARCRRCGAPLCEEHVPKPATRCEPCEERFLEGRNRAVFRLAVFELILVALIAGGLAGLLPEHQGPTVLEPLPPPVTFVGMILLLGFPPLLLTPLRRSVFLLSRKRWRGVDD